MVNNSSAIRAMFEEGNRMRKEFGADNVFDFSLGNPNVAAPAAVKEAIKELVDEEDPVVLHGYTNNAGYEDVRQTVAESLNERFQTSFGAHNITMTVGAAGGLNVALKALLNPGDEVIVFAPYFGEYRSPSDPAHKGMDFGTNGQAVPTYAAADGTVIIAGWSNSAGNWVVINHGNGIVTKYMHHSALCVTAGQKVTKGQQLGLTGTTGNSTGVHLHFQVEVNGKAVDPRTYL